MVGGTRSITLAILALALLPASAAASVPTQIIVKRDAGLTAAERRDVRADADVRFVESLPLPRTEVVAAAPGDVRDALRDLNADPDVVYAELDRPVEALSNDPEFMKLWGLHNAGNFSFGTAQATADADMDVPEAWTSSTGLGRTVAVVDSGVDAAHPDLAGRVAVGWDFVDEDPFAQDPHGHGTHVAGTIAAIRDNAIGVAGVAPDARVLPLRVLEANGTGEVSDTIEAYDRAGDLGISIVNASLGGEGFVQAEYDAIQRNPDTLFVVAAGNDNEDNDVAAQDPEYPCSYDLPNILCVGASTHQDKRAAGFSNYGATTVDVFAPGYGTYSTVPGGGYGWKDGTSMATPHVAGAAALLAARNPELAPADVKTAILGSAEPKADLAGKAVTGGRANANDALMELDFDGDWVADGIDVCPAVPAQEECPPGADADGDAVPLPADLCPAEAAAYAPDGCPQADPGVDGDHWPDAIDNCPAVSNPGQEDSDGDGLGNACDNCPAVANAGQGNADGDAYGDACEPDRDADGVVDDTDNCDLTPGGAPTGCPPVAPPPTGGGEVVVTPPPPPPPPAAVAAQVSSVSAKAKRRGARRTATVVVRTTGPATVRITVERKRGRRWARVARKTRTVAGLRTTLTVKGLKRGAHRVRISITSAGGRGTPVTKGFRVR